MYPIVKKMGDFIWVLLFCCRCNSLLSTLVPQGNIGFRLASPCISLYLNCRVTRRVYRVSGWISTKRTHFQMLSYSYYQIYSENFGIGLYSQMLESRTPFSSPNELFTTLEWVWHNSFPFQDLYQSEYYLLNIEQVPEPIYQIILKEISTPIENSSNF